MLSWVNGKFNPQWWENASFPFAFIWKDYSNYLHSELKIFLTIPFDTTRSSLSSDLVACQKISNMK